MYLSAIGNWMYLRGGGAASCVCARYECPEIRMLPRILVAIKRRPAVSPSAYGTECRWRLEKAEFWNAGNAVCTGPTAALPPQLTAPTLPLHSHTHNTPSSSRLSRASRLGPEALSCLPSSRLLPCLSQRGGALGCSLQLEGFYLFQPCHAREHHSPAAPAPKRTHSPALRPGIVQDHRGWGKGWQHPPG